MAPTPADHDKVIRNDSQAESFATNSLVFIVLFWGLNQVANLFEVAPGVSLFYPPSAFAMLLLYLLGPKYLPVHFIAILLGGLPDREIWNYDLELLLPDLRQFLVYGAAGLVLRRAHPRTDALDARFFCYLLLASFITALASTFVFVVLSSGQGNPPASPLFDAAASFFVGNLTGALSAIPLFLCFHQLRSRGWSGFRATISARILRPDKVMVFLAMIGLTLLVFELGGLNESFSRYYYLILLPIIWTSVRWGLGIGLFFAFSGNVFALALLTFSGFSHYGVMEVQIMFAISIISAILIGLVHDQKNLFFQRSMFDELTGLANMRLFRELTSNAIARAKRNNEESAVLFIDLDGFKSINDRFGHKQGDVLLRQASERIRNCVRNADCIARFGGDEFVIYLDQTNATGANNLAQKILVRMSEPFDLKDGKETLGASIGAAIYPEDGESVDALIQNADLAMYSAKQNGKNSLSLYSESFPETRAPDTELR